MDVHHSAAISKYAVQRSLIKSRSLKSIRSLFVLCLLDLDEIISRFSLGIRYPKALSSSTWFQIPVHLVSLITPRLLPLPTLPPCFPFRSYPCQFVFLVISLSISTCSSPATIYAHPLTGLTSSRTFSINGDLFSFYLHRFTCDVAACWSFWVFIFSPALISHFIPKRYAASPVSRCMTLQNGDTGAAQYGELVVDWEIRLKKPLHE